MKLKKFRWEDFANSHILYCGDREVGAINKTLTFIKKYDLEYLSEGLFEETETKTFNLSQLPEAKAWAEQTVRAEINSLFEEEDNE